MSTNFTNSSKSVLFKRKRNVAITFFWLGIFAAALAFYAKSRRVVVQARETTPYEVKTLKGFRNIRPVISIDPKEEAEKFLPLKEELLGVIDSFKAEGKLQVASVYLKQLNKGYWLSIGEDEKYHPASLMKVPLMLAVLKAAEANPDLLRKEFTYQKALNEKVYEQHFISKGIEENRPYTVHELLYYCVANSDNKAAHALQNNIDLSTVVSLFSNVGLPKPDLKSNDYQMTAKDYSTFINSVFYSSFLSPEYSEYATELMENSSFHDGLEKGLPTNTTSWRKFGEWVGHDGIVELHESGVYYLDGKPYLLTVMTRGKNFDTLSEVLRKVAYLSAKRTAKLELGKLEDLTMSQKTVSC